MTLETRYCEDCGQAMKLYSNGKQRNGNLQRKWKCNACENKRKAERNPNWLRERKARQKERNPQYRRKEFIQRLERNPVHYRELATRYQDRPRKGYIARLEAQNGVCAICGKGETRKLHGKIKALALDHNHETGQLRGLLCGKCNSGLGFFDDNPSRLRAAADYLEDWKQVT